jgi:hypothetical protein
MMKRRQFLFCVSCLSLLFVCCIAPAEHANESDSHSRIKPRPVAASSSSISETNRALLLQLIQTRKDELARQEQNVISISSSLRNSKALANGTIVVSIPVALAGGALVVAGGKVIINTIKDVGINGLFVDLNFISTPVAIAALAVGSAMLSGDYVVIKLTQENKNDWEKKLKLAQKRLKEIKIEIERAEDEVKSLNGK